MTSPVSSMSRRIAFVIASGVCFSLVAADESAAWEPPQGRYAPAPRAPDPDVRAGGALDVSYNYHQQGPNAGVRPPGPWYGWGFPVQTYRWGWFGAAHYYPWCYWHEGYYGNCCRHAYRCGY